MVEEGPTTSAGAPVPDIQNVLTARRHGQQLLLDVWYLEKLAHHDRELSPERRLHATGSGALGTFTGPRGHEKSHPAGWLRCSKAG